jgi:hypothetical protein
MAEVEIGSSAWTDAHVEAGDKALADAEQIADGAMVSARIIESVSATVSAFAAIAQAHYAAAALGLRAR